MEIQHDVRQRVADRLPFMDAFEQYVRAGLELSSTPVSDVDLAVMRAADAIYGPQLRALSEADLSGVWAETVLDPSTPPVAS